MPSIIEGSLTFDFPSHWKASKFDNWIFYRNQFQKVCGGSKAIDILAIEPKVCFWVLEIKDYRLHPRVKAIGMVDEMTSKVRDTLAALVAAKVNANDDEEKDLATKALQCSRIRVVLHLEQPIKHSTLFPRAINPANVLLSLRRLIKAIDPHPLVIETNRMLGVAWTAR